MNDVVKYEVNTAAIAKMSDIYMQLKIDGVDDEAGASEVHAAKMIVVKHRTNINKLRLGTNRNAQDFIKKNNKDAAVLIDALAPIEGHLKAEEGKVDAEKERIATEKKAAEELKTEKRVTALFAVDVNIPYFDAAMLDDAEFEAMFGEATEIYQAKQLELEEEKMAKAAEEKRLADEKTAQEAEANRLAEIQAAQETKERELKEQQEAIEDEKKKAQEAIEKAKREDQERIDREAFEKQAVKDARIQAEKDAENEKLEQIAKVEETRLRSLQAVGFVYPAKDLGTMQDKKFFALHDKHKKAWDKKQKEILAEKIEQERIKKEKTAAAEKARLEKLRPDCDKLIRYAASILKLSAPDVKDKQAQEILEEAQDGLGLIASKIMTQVKGL